MPMLKNVLVEAKKRQKKVQAQPHILFNVAHHLSDKYWLQLGGHIYSGLDVCVALVGVPRS